MARCAKCHGEFEGARQPNCPLCGAVRPRPQVKVVERPVVQVTAAPPPPPPGARETTKRRGRRRESPPPAPSPASAPQPRAAATVTQPRQAPPIRQDAVRTAPQPAVAAPRPRSIHPPASGAPAVEVEYVFSGSAGDGVFQVSTLAVLPPRPTVDLGSDEGSMSLDMKSRLTLAGSRALDAARNLRKR